MNKRGFHRKDDSWEPHCCGLSCHSGVTITGSDKVYVNGKPAARINDKINCNWIEIIYVPDGIEEDEDSPDFGKMKMKKIEIEKSGNSQIVTRF